MNSGYIRDAVLGGKIKFEYNVRQWEELVLLLPDSFTGITL